MTMKVTTSRARLTQVRLAVESSAHLADDHG
jgi:hypothetical protein